MAESDHIEPLSASSPPDSAGIRPGTVRRMGENGPIYEVLGLADSSTIEIRIVGSNEPARYPLDCFLADSED